MIDLCPDRQSPELAVPCTTPSIAPPSGPSIDGLPFTGFDVLWLVLVALFIIGFGWWLIRRGRAEVDAE